MSTEPAIAPLFLALGAALAARGRHAEAADALRRALAEPEEDKPLRRIRAGLAAALLHGGDPAGALRTVLELAAEAPGDAVPLLDELLLRLHPGHARAADGLTGTDWREVLADSRTAAADRRALLGFLARALLLRKDPRYALKLLTDVPELAEGDAELLGLRARTELQLGLVDQAEGTLLEAPRSADIVLRLAWLYEQTDRPEKALTLLETAEELWYEPAAIEVYALLALGQVETAEVRLAAHVERFGAGAQSMVQAQVWLALAKHDYEAARAAADTGLGTYPEDLTLTFLLLQAVVEEGSDLDVADRLARLTGRMDPVDLRPCLDRSVRTRPPGDPALHHFLAALRGAQGDRVAALAEADTALGLLDAGGSYTAVLVHRLRGGLLEESDPRASAEAYARAADLAYELQEPGREVELYQMAVDLYRTADGLGTITRVQRFTWADALLVLSFVPTEPQGVATGLVLQACEVWDAGVGGAALDGDLSWAYVSRARMCLQLAKGEPFPSAQALRALACCEMYFVLAEGSSTFYDAYGLACRLLGAYGLSTRVYGDAGGAAEPVAPDLLITAAVNAGDLAVAEAVLPESDRVERPALARNSRARVLFLRGEARAALDLLYAAPEDERDGLNYWWERIACRVLAGEDPADDVATALAGVDRDWTGWESLVAWMRLFNGDADGALELFAGYSDEASYIADAAAETALAELALGSGDPADALRFVRQTRSFEDVATMRAVCTLLASRYPDAAGPMGEVVAEAARRLGDEAEFWPLTAEGDATWLLEAGFPGEAGDWARVAGLAARARLAAARQDWALASASYRALIPDASRYLELDQSLSQLCWQLADVEEREPLDGVAEVVRELRRWVPRRPGVFPAEWSVADLLLLRGDRAGALEWYTTLPLTADDPNWGQLTIRRFAFAALTGDRPGALEWLLATAGAAGDAAEDTVAPVMEALNALVTDTADWPGVVEVVAAVAAEAGVPLLEAAVRHAWGLALTQRDRFPEAVEHLRAELALRLAVQGPDHSETAQARYDLGWALYRVEEFAAAETELRAVIGAWTRDLGPESPSTLAVRGELATNLLDAGRLDEAEAEYREVLEINRRVRGEDDRETLSTWYGVARVLGSRYDWPAAEAEYRRILEARERALGPGADDTILTRYRLAWVIFQQDRLREAEEAYLQVIEGWTALLGPENLSTVNARTELAGVLAAAERYEEAEALYRDVLEIDRRGRGELDPETLSAWYGLARTLGRRGEWAAAEVEYAGLLAARIETRGEADDDTILTRYRRAWMLYQLDRLDESKAEYRKVVAGWTALLGPEDLSTLNARAELAGVLFESRDLDEAEAEYREVLEIDRRVRGSDDPETLNAWYGVGRVLGWRGDWDAAEAEYRPVLEAREQVLGPDHDDTILTRYRLAYVLYQKGLLEEAEEAYRQVVAAWREQLGPDASLLLNARMELGRVQLEAGRPDEAVETLQAVVADMIRVLGPDRAETLEARYELARVFAQRADWAAAVPLYEEVLAARRELLGDDSPDTLLTRYRLAWALNGLGEPERSAAEYRTLLAAWDRTGAAGTELTAEAYAELAMVLREAGDVTAAVEVYREAIARFERLYDDGEGLANLRYDLGLLLLATDDDAGAEVLLRQVVAAMTAEGGPDDRLAMLADYHVGSALLGMGRFEEAVPHLRRVVEHETAVLGAEADDTLVSRRALGSALAASGDVPAAVTEFQAVLAVRERELGAADPEVAELRERLAELLDG